MREMLPWLQSAELGSYSIVSRMTSTGSEYSLRVEQREDIKDLSAEESTGEQLEYDDCDSVSQNQEPQADHPCVSYQPFPKHITQVLESFYVCGMTGWGKKYRSDIASAAGATGLEQSQIAK